MTNAPEKQNQERSRSKSGQDFESFDLSGGLGGVHEKWATLNVIDDRTANLFGRELSRALGEAIEASVCGGGVRKFRDVADELESPGCLNYLEFEALGGFGLVAIEQALLFALLERLFGAADAPAPEDDRPAKTRFSAIEERVIRRVVLLFGRALEQAWRPIVPLTVRHSRVETKPVNVAIARPGEWVVTTEVALEVGAKSGRVVFALPHALLESYRERLATGQYEEKATSDAGWKRALRVLMQEVPVDLVAELGRADLTLGRLLELSVGDVVRLDQASEKAISVSVDDVPKYRGEITVAHGNLAVELTDIHEDAYHAHNS
jgi:flagellar motor switch protein FliM